MPTLLRSNPDITLQKRFMTKLKAENIWCQSRSDLKRILDRGLIVDKSRKIRFYAPSFMYYRTNHFCSTPNVFPTISITGHGCSLHCKHCDGKVLETMFPAETPEKLYSRCRKLKAEGALGCLISGGCTSDGSVPLGKFIRAIARVRKDLGLTVLVHTGIVDTTIAESLKQAGVDAALVDIIGSDETIRQVYDLTATVDDYYKSLGALQSSGVAFVPHVIVGLHDGKLKGELQALHMISNYKPSALVVIAFMPIRGTPMGDVDPPEPLDVAKVLGTARVMFPSTPLALGCMRPQGRHRAETDVLAVKSGVDAIAFPAEEAIMFAEQEGCEVSFSSFCCSQIYRDLLT